jgi:ABC-type proline/glycine betaine transport system substrate-binding protein
MTGTREAMASFGLEDFRLIEGSEQTMTELLAQTIRHKRQIVITDWTPHWMFARWNLRFLNDPQGCTAAPSRFTPWCDPTCTTTCRRSMPFSIDSAGHRKRHPYS